MTQRTESELLARTLDFFGRVTASATHEIKNELAVMNEQSRLVQEMLALGRQGREADPRRLEELIGRVVARLERADEAVRRLNQFAHSADLDRGRADAGQALAVVAALFGRIADRHGVGLAVEERGAAAEADCRPILLEQALWGCLEAVAAAAQPGAEVAAAVERGERGPAVSFRAALARPVEPPPAAVLEPLGARAEVLEEGGLRLALPGAGGREGRP
jgi:C4-dicarboxylate-specific signal transduction histidine kinase